MLRLIFQLLKAGIFYIYKAGIPIWVTIKTIGPYKVAAVGMTFSNFFLNIYTFSQKANASAFNLVFKSAATTLTGSLNQILQSGETLLYGPGIIDRFIAVGLIAFAVSTWYLYILAWEMIRSRVPQTAWYLLLAFSLLALVWGNNGSQELFQVLDLGREAAQIAANETVNQTANQTINSTG